MRHRNAILILAGAALLIPSLLAAQVTTALLQGRALDQNGAVISGASVEARNLDTGLRRTATTDQDGSYRLPALPLGRWEITATASGFSREIRSGITLQVGQQAEVDFTLKVATEETLTVTAEPPIIETTESAIGTTFTTRQIDELPLPNRNFTELASLTPGVQNSVTEAGTGISASGGSGSSNTFLIDGVSGDAESLGGQRTTLSPDVVAEFEVLSSQYSAEFGRASGAVINVVTRAGTNDMRGRISAFYRDDSLTEDNPFAVVTDEETPFSQQIFNAFLGGPFSRDRAFYFASYERSTSDFTALITVNPSVLAALGLDTDRTVEQPTDQDRFFGKFDLIASPAQMLTLRMDYDKLVTENFLVGGTLTREVGATQRLEERNAVLSHTWIVNPQIVNDLRVQYGVDKTDLTDVNCPGCPFISRPSVSTGKPGNFPQRFEEQRLQFVETLTFDVLQKGGDHSFKAGADVSRVELPVFVPQNFDGVFIFATDRPFNPGDPTTFPQIYQQGRGEPGFTISSNIYGFFVQDQWRMTPDFTLNLGLRWDYEDHAAISDDRNNFAPRIHFAWDPFSNGKTLVRGGGGIYYDPIFLNVPLIGEFLAPGRFVLETILSPGFPDPRVGGAQIPFPLPPTAAILDPNAETPEATILSLGLVREIASDLALSVDLVHARGRNRLLQIDANAPVGGRRPDPAFGLKIMVQTRGRSEYDGLHIGLQKRFGGRYSLNAAYTLAENESTADSHRAFVSNSNDLDADFGPSLNDIRHTFNAAINVNAPWGFSIGLGGSFRTGAPYNITTGLDNNGDAVVNDRPAGVGRNSGRGGSVHTVNLRVAKLITFHDIDLELIAEGFNLFDTTNETSYIGNMRSPSFGKPTNTLTGAFGPRQIQLGARLNF